MEKDTAVNLNVNTLRSCGMENPRPLAACCFGIVSWWVAGITRDRDTTCRGARKRGQK
jgi:hypothetical protein